MKFCLPSTYINRSDHVLYNDSPSNLVYQPNVYQLAGYLATRANLKWIIDIGCGSAGKLVPFAEQFSLIGIDSQFGIDMARKAIPAAKLIVHDLETALPNLPDEVLINSLIICSDVIEHLQKPNVLMAQLAELSRRVPYIIVSTPDRDRARGWLDDGPPANPAHVMEWNGTEFVRFMRESGFDEIPFHGHTINTDFHRAKTTVVSISGEHVRIKGNVPSKKIAAIIHAYNEADVLPETVRHLVDQGVEVHYFDNWSTDGSWEIVQALMTEGSVKNCERFPGDPSDNYEWHKQLTKTSEYAKTLDAEWVMHHDADEIRISPWDGVKLNEAIAHIDALGFNAIDFTVIDFRFIENGPRGEAPYQESLTHFEFGRRPGHFLQVKCWKNASQVDLANSGGHDASFGDRNIYPIKFLLKHYPLRNKPQANKKVFESRLPRFGKEKEIYGWHSQYDRFAGVNDIVGWKYSELVPWHSIHFKTEYVIERISGIGLVDINSDTVSKVLAT
jgi:glycosyltransferase involved in cell wall biosynthesis